MAYTYRVFGETSWMASSGSGLLAVTNKTGSAKTISIKSLEVVNTTRRGVSVTPAAAGTAATDALPTCLALGFVTSMAKSETLTPSALDTAASAWPSTVKLYKQVAVSGGTFISKVCAIKALNATATFATHGLPRSITGLNNASGMRNFGSVWGRNISTTVDPLVVRANEKLALWADVVNGSAPYIVDVQLVRTGSPDRTFFLSFFSQAVADATALFAIDNESGSGETVYVKDVNVYEVGTSDTPYFQLVPISQVSAASQSDTTRTVSVVKCDTDAPDFTSATGQVFFNVPVYPAAGIPFEYCAPGGGGSPKGFNYMHTKDFSGPVYATMLPEFVPLPPAGIVPTDIGWTRNQSRQALKPIGANIVLNPGDGLALVSGGETATSGLGTSGWQTFEFGLTLVVEDTISIAVTVVDEDNNPVENVRVRVIAAETAGTVTTGDQLLLGLTDVNGLISATFSWESAFGAGLDVTIVSRKATAPPYYKASTLPGTVTSEGLATTAVLLPDT